MQKSSVLNRIPDQRPCSNTRASWYPDRWNEHNPDEYLSKLQSCDEDQLRKEANRFIWLSAFANNNPRSDYHWMCDAIYDECQSRGRLDIYRSEYKRLSRG